MTQDSELNKYANNFSRALNRDYSTSRETNALGDEPRIPPLNVEDVSDDLLQIISRMAQVNSAVNSRDPEMLTDLMSDHAAGNSNADIAGQVRNLPEIVRTMLRHPNLFARQTDIGIQLLSHGALSARDRELAVLRIGWLCQAPYEWGEHVLIAKNIGITSEEIERITQGAQAAGWNEHERAIVRATEELYENSMISDATWAVLTKYLNDQQLIELPIVIGQYQTVAYYQNSLRLRLHEGNLGLKAR